MHLIRLTLRRSKVLFWLPVATIYGVLPAVVAASSHDDAMQNLVLAARILLPPSSILWGMSYLQMWIESDGQETMRACSRGNHSTIPELLLLNIGFLFVILPGVLIASSAYGSLFDEYLYLVSQILWISGAFYVLSILLHSVAMSGMLVFAYLLFCVFYSNDSTMRGFCLLKIETLSGWNSLMSESLPPVMLAGILMVAGHIGERFYFRKY